MRLSVRSWGSGPRTALLVHGFSDDAQTWWCVGPRLADLGFTVLAPDLRGHGCSARADSYLLEDFAADLADTLPVGADLAVGHSLGAMALALAVPSLAPRRTVLVDPAWWRTDLADGLERVLPRLAEELPPETRAWPGPDIAVELASNAQVDVAVGRALAAVVQTGGFLPPPGRHDALVLVPELEPLLLPEVHEAVAALGYRVRTHGGVRHVLHRDDPDGLLEVLSEEVRRPVLVG